MSKVLSDPSRHLICPICNHPVWKDGPDPEVHEDEEGQYVECLVCHNKVYFNEPIKID